MLQVMNEDGHTSSIRDKILTITVKRGWKPGTKITFLEEGDQGPNNVPGNSYIDIRTFMAKIFFEIHDIYHKVLYIFQHFPIKIQLLQLYKTCTYPKSN